MLLTVLVNSYGGGPYHIEPSPLIFSAKQSTDFHMIGTSAMKELIDSINEMCNIPACLSTLNLREKLELKHSH